MFNNPYLTKQLIAYIGNKRALLPFLSDVFNRLDIGRQVSFSDPFAGSGAVSRLAKLSGFQVFTNDWEYYSYMVNSCYLGVNKDESLKLFRDRGGIKKTFSMFNDLKNDFDPYISRHYSPKNTDSADYYTERLFYTKENGVFIDRARTLIEDLYPAGNLNPVEEKEKSILLASLLYEVSTHANTSGVFKACHKGFGGHGKDALGRILAPMSMEIPHLVDSPYSCKVFQMDAVEFVKGVSTDICYLDPPYNMHQYGSNYFMLNTVALWDKPAVNQSRGDDGRYIEKAGIRKDWKKTKSPYCYKSLAPDSFSELMENIDSRYIILSYNTEGIIPFNVLFDIMERHGKVNLHIKDYVLYRGGKQSLARKNHNMELLLVVDRKGKPDGKDRLLVERFLKERRVLNQLRTPFNPDKLNSKFSNSLDEVTLSNQMQPLKVFKGYKFIEQPQDLNRLKSEELDELFNRLGSTQCQDNLEETQVLINLLEGESEIRSIKKLQKRLLTVYKKLAFKKYKVIFDETSKVLNNKIKNRDLNFTELKTGVEEIQEIAELRFKG